MLRRFFAKHVWARKFRAAKELPPPDSKGPAKFVSVFVPYCAQSWKGASGCLVLAKVPSGHFDHKALTGKGKGKRPAAAAADAPPTPVRNLPLPTRARACSRADRALRASALARPAGGRGRRGLHVLVAAQHRRAGVPPPRQRSRRQQLRRRPRAGDIPLPPSTPSLGFAFSSFSRACAGPLRARVLSCGLHAEAVGTLNPRRATGAGVGAAALRAGDVRAEEGGLQVQAARALQARPAPPRSGGAGPRGGVGG